MHQLKDPSDVANSSLFNNTTELPANEIALRLDSAVSHSNPTCNFCYNTGEFAFLHNPRWHCFVTWRLELCIMLDCIQNNYCPLHYAISITWNREDVRSAPLTYPIKLHLKENLTNPCGLPSGCLESSNHRPRCWSNGPVHQSNLRQP